MPKNCLVSIFVLTLFISILILAKPTMALADNCTNISPSSAPNLFQIKRASASAQLFFSPLPTDQTISGYTISYGFTPGDERYATSFAYGSSTGVVAYTINSLDYKEGYVFKVRADNGCAPGPWSNYRSDGIHPATTTTNTKAGLPVTGSTDNTIYALYVLVSLVLAGSFIFFNPHKILFKVNK